MRAAKELEFRSVAVMACDDDIIPLSDRIVAICDQSDPEDIYYTERHLLYLAFARGDAATRRSKSNVYAESRSVGLHAIIKAARSYSQGDLMLYQGIAAYLDASHLPKLHR